MKKLIIASAALLAASSVSATVSAVTFNGPFVGAQITWNHDEAGSVGTSVGRVNPSNEHDAFIGGAFVGYDYKIAPKVVIGAEAGFSIGADDALTGGAAGSALVLDPKYSIDVSTRAGYLVQENTLVYVRGGYSNVRANVRLTEASGVRSGEDNRDAWMVGGGVEHAITQNISARLEYRYSDLSEGRGSWDRHQMLLGATYRF
ncbi:outer membrane protein [Novosphingobium panipatense]|uniref:Outer membrane immunogenic protein n=1 Tax=Novosphingobium panipatense TaxID=428991 RepID=A0ABY1QWZ4_9SPHN|nr:outer membrane beta-barrel protein [Novosphingobium panipatense]SMP81125.1 outer membrane immunogenic protein [Novosphingobium panipatense]